MKLRSVLALCLILSLALPGLGEESINVEAELSADARERADYFALIENDAVINIRVPEENPYFRDIDGVLFSKDGENLLLYPNGRTDKEYAVPEGTKTIEEECTFGYGCKVEKLILPASFERIGGAGLFRTVIKEFAVDEKNPRLKAIDGVLFTRDGKTLVSYPPGRTDETYHVPEGTERIGDWAFNCNEHLLRVEMPDSLKSIGDFAFDECEKLRSVRLPERMEALGRSAFGFCYELEELILPKGITALPLHLLVCDNLSGALHIPHTVKDIDDEALCFLPRLTDLYLPDGLETICGTYSIDNSDLEWDVPPLHLIYGWNDTGVADYTVVLHAHEGTFGAVLLQNSGGFPHVITPLGVDAPDASEYARLISGAMARCGHPDAEICRNDVMDMLPEKPLIAYTLHTAIAVFREDGKLLLCGFDDLDGAWALKWVNDQLLQDGVKPVKLAHYGDELMELILPDKDDPMFAVQYWFRAGGEGLAFSEAHAYQDYLYDDCQKIWQCQARPTESGRSALRFAKRDDYEKGLNENGEFAYIRVPGEEIATLSIENPSLLIERFAGVTPPEE